MEKSTQNIPEYLRHFVVEQDASLYTPIDHASWRFILKVSRDFFAEKAHQKYRDGLRETGISLERIPLISEMDECLRRFGWRAVAVSGFIPPGVFMEFLSLGVLPIACDMRSLEHLAYTPAPDIVHEAAGHAPIVADPSFSRYLRSYGELARKAIFSSKDMDVYNAVRHLSDIKESPSSSVKDVQDAEERLEKASAAVDYVSEATELSRMGWWTFEYGLVGKVDQPKIYGAGLLSSIGESYNCFGPAVKRIPFSLACIEMGFDITKPQPQLFVAESFDQLIDALDDLANRMAFRLGGVEGLSRAKKAATVTTVQMDSGVQVSGVLADFRIYQGKPCYLQFKGPSQISFGDVECPGQGADYHREGFGSPIGLLSDGRSLETLVEADFGKSGILKFASGVEVRGKLKSLTPGKIVSFTDCTVTLGNETLFKPEWGVFDMICGTEVTSVFGGAADRKQYLSKTGGFHQDPGKPKTNLTAENRALNELYAQVRKTRESASTATALFELDAIHQKLEAAHPQDWLLRFEILELARTMKLTLPFETKIHQRLSEISKISTDREEMITRALQLLSIVSEN